MRLHSRDEFPGYLNQVGLTGFAIEVGVWKGDHARSFLRVWKGQKLTLVDPYQAPGPVTEWGKVMKQPAFDEAYKSVQKLLAAYPGRCELLKMTSAEAAAQLKSLRMYDFIYLDASHRYDDVCRDLEAWWPLVKPGGIFAGHDYIDARGATGTGRPIAVQGDIPPDKLRKLDFGVRSAVDAFCCRQGLIDRLKVTWEDQLDYRSWWVQR